MKKEITAEQFRQDRLNELNTTRDWINKNYETLWELAKEAQIVVVEAVRIDTAFGVWQFIPKLKIKD